MRPIHYYLLGTGSWFLSVGIQGVMFAWLVTMLLQESAQRLGMAQMTLLLPGTLLILAGGGLSDQHGGRRIALIGQSLGLAAPLTLIALLLLDHLNYTGMLVYALIMGTAQALVTPARDGLLNQVAGGRVQRAVMLASATQFGMQVLGFLAASLADRAGAIAILCLQSLALVAGLLVFRKLPTLAPELSQARPTLASAMLDGARTVLKHPVMRLVVVQNVVMATFFMGSYMVALPLVVRDVYQGSAADLAIMNGVNSLGLVLMILLLLRIGDQARQGRLLILSHLVGAGALAASALAPTFTTYLGVLFLWGICGGVAMTMSRTIMQEQAPAAQRGMVMGVHAFTFIGAGPVGALLNGFLAQSFGPRSALLICACGVAIAMLMLGFRSPLWRMRAGRAVHDDSRMSAG